MTTLGSCASIVQLAFALNAVAAAVEFRFRSSHRRLLTRMYRDLRPENDALKGPDVELVFSKYIYESSPGLRTLRGFYRFVALAGIVAVIVSFFGLVIGAINSGRPVADAAVWIYAAVSLIILPVLYWSAPRFLTWFEREYARVNLDTAAKQETLWEAFRACYTAECHLREMRDMTALAKEMTAALNESRRLRRWARWREKLPGRLI